MRRTRSWVSPDGQAPAPSVSFQTEESPDHGVGYLQDQRLLAPTPPLKDEQYESYGFVQVGEDLESGAYSLKRSKSTNSIDREESLYRVNRNLERQLRILQYEVQRLKTKISLVEETNDRWGARYCRQVCLFANATVGAWKYWHTLFSFLQKRKGALLTQVVVNRKTDSLNRVIVEGIFVALQSSFPLIFSAMLLSRNSAWKRTLGATISGLWALYLAIYSKFHPWTNYFLMLSSLLYLTAAYNSPNGVPTLREFNQEQQSENGND